MPCTSNDAIAQCLERKTAFAIGQRSGGLSIYESHELDPKTIEDVNKLGGVWHDIPRFVDTRKADITQKFYFGLTTIRVHVTFENPNGKDVVKSLEIDHDYHGN